MLNQYLDVFRSLDELDVRYLVIGEIAAAIHGVPRATFDLDLLIEATSENAERLLEALEQAGLGTATLTTPERVLEQEITIFSDRVRVDVQTRTPGIDFAEAYERRMEPSFRNAKLKLLSREDLIASKKASGRKVDLDDVAALTGVNNGD